MDRVASPSMRARTGIEDIDTWLKALSGSFLIPEGYRTETVDRISAMEVLRCDDQVLDRLVRAGLPCAGEPGAELFDAYDLFNLGLHSGTGLSSPELAIRFTLRWMQRPAQTWFAPVMWNFSTKLSCGLPACGSNQLWQFAKPSGSQLVALDLSPADAVVGEDDITATGPDPLAASAVLLTEGSQRTIRSSTLKDICSEYTSDDYRWAKMPEALQSRPELVLPSGVAPCISVSLDLAAKCRAAGFPAYTRRGWLVGVFDHGHSWLEVIDDDGELKCVDPTFEMLSAYAGSPNAAFRTACQGSFFNRVVRTTHQADNPLFGHQCGEKRSLPRTQTTIRIARQPRHGVTRMTQTR